MDRGIWKLVTAWGLLCVLAAQGADFKATWNGSSTWIGPEYWTTRWQDWNTENGRLHVESRNARSCLLLTREVIKGDGRFELTTTVQAEPGVNVPAGFWVGTRGPVEGNWQSAAGYGDYGVFAGIRPGGVLVLRDASGKRTGTSPADKLRPAEPVTLTLTVQITGEQAELKLSASQGATTLDIKTTYDTADVRGLVGLGTADVIGEPRPNRGPAPRWLFHNFSATGDGLSAHEDRTFGPIGFTQYTCVEGVFKLTAQMMPIGPDDAQTVNLTLDQPGLPPATASSRIDPVSRTAHFRVENVDAARGGTYRVSYEWRGKAHTFEGKVRPEPTGPMSIAVMSCDWGYAFPNAPLVKSVAQADPDLLFYAGDQIYEHFGRYGIEREPLDRSAIDYLRKYSMFGWLNRDLLRDRPSLIIPDDHDNYQGNIWGAGGRKQPPGGDEMGGYRQSVEWVNAMQRTQTWHIPDAVDPTPVGDGITVYYGGFVWGNVAFAVLEDRKWKTGYRSIWGPGVKQPTDAEGLDPPGTSLLGERQEKFLAEWAKAHPERVHVAVSQTIFAKTHTHGGPKLGLSGPDKDTNGWPRTPRNRAVRLLHEAKALHLCGDQHLGILAQLGVDKWTDGPLTFMVPGTVNGWPRARWPELANITSVDGGSPLLGRYVDDFGNQFTVLGVANPEPGSNLLKSPEISPDEIARRKGSGFGIVRIDPAQKTATFEMWRYGANPARPAAEDQFEGFPQTYMLEADGWTRRAR